MTIKTQLEIEAEIAKLAAMKIRTPAKPWRRGVEGLVGDLKEKAYVGAAGTLEVATSGAAYNSIQDAIDAAAANQDILVYPGEYAENISFAAAASGIRVIGVGSAQNVVITGADTTSTRVVMSKTSTIRNCAVKCPSSGTNPGVDCTGLGVGNIAIIEAVVILGDGGTGPGVSGCGSGILVSPSGIFHNGGSLGEFIKITGGTAILNGLIATVGTSTDFIKVTGGVVSGNSWQALASTFYNTTDFIEISGGDLLVTGVQLPETLSPAVNAIHISGDGLALELQSSHINGSTYDLLVDAALTGAGSKVTWTGVDFRDEKFFSNSGGNWINGIDFVGVYNDQGFQNDHTYRIATNTLAVGTPEVPTELAVGTGDSSVRGMEVWTDDGTGTSFVDKTEEAKSSSGSTFGLQSLASGESFYIGTQILSKPADYKLNFDSVGDLGSSTVKAEIWTGAAWAEIEYMVGDTEAPYSSYATNIYSVSAERVRLNIENTNWTNWAMSDPGMGTTAYWIRFVNVGAITTNPAIQRIKIGFSRSEINSDGTVEHFGAGEPYKSLGGVDLRMTDTIQGASPSNENIDYGTNINIVPSNNEFVNNAVDAIGGIFHIEEGMDTSRKVRLRIRFAQTAATAAGDVEWEFSHGTIRVGTVLDGAQTEHVDTVIVTTGGVQDAVMEAEINFDLTDTTPGDSVAYALRRDATAGNLDDTFAGNVYIVSLVADARFWRS